MQTRRALLSGGAAIAALGMAPAEKILLLGGATTASSLDLNFVQNPTLDSRITFTRASGATYFDSTNTLQTAATNVARFDYGPTSTTPLGLLIEEARTNSIRNNTMVGAVIGTPGTYPTNWTQSQNTGIVPSVIAFGTESGIAYVDLRFNGTTAGGANNNVLFDSAVVAATPSQTWTSSFYMRLVGGSTANIANLQMLYGDNIANMQSTISFPTDAPLATQRYATTWTTNAGAVTQLGPRGLQIVPNAAPVAIDITLRIGLPQWEAGGFATSAITTTSAAATRAIDSATLPATSWYNAAAGSLVGEVIPVNDGAFHEMPSLVTDAGNALLVRQAATTAMHVVSFVGGVNDGDTVALTALTVGATTKYGVTYNATTLGVSIILNGSGPPATGTVTALPAVTHLAIGTTRNGNPDCCIRRVRYWPRMLSNAELQQVTT